MRFAIVSCVLVLAALGPAREKPPPIEPREPPSFAFVLEDWTRGGCKVPARVSTGAKIVVELAPRRCAVTAPGDVLTVFRRGERWLVR